MPLILDEWVLDEGLSWSLTGLPVNIPTLRTAIHTPHAYPDAPEVAQ